MASGQLISEHDLSGIYEGALEGLREQEAPDDPLSYLVDYATERAGVRTRDEMRTWIRDMYVRSQESKFKNQTTGNRLGDLAMYLRYSDSLRDRVGLT